MAIANPHGLRGYLDAIADVNTLSAPQRPFDVQGRVTPELRDFCERCRVPVSKAVSIANRNPADDVDAVAIIYRKLASLDQRGQAMFSAYVSRLQA